MDLFKLEKGDVTTVTSGVVPHGVNCQGKMGSGVAKAIKDKWPKVYNVFMNSGTGIDMLGKAVSVPVEENVVIFNIYSQEFYGNDGKVYASAKAIEESLNVVYIFAKLRELPVIMPKIGSDRGGLDWETEIVPIINKMIETHEVDTTVYFL